MDEVFNEFMELKDEYDDVILLWYRDLYLELKKFQLIVMIVVKKISIEKNYK